MTGILRAIAISGVDLGIIAAALVYVTLTSYTEGDLLRLVLTVFIVYIIIVGVTEFLLLAFQGQGKFVMIARTALATGFVLWLFPKVLFFVLLILGYQVAADVESVLFCTVIIRTVIRAILGRMWRSNKA